MLHNCNLKHKGKRPKHINKHINKNVNPTHHQRDLSEIIHFDIQLHLGWRMNDGYCQLEGWIDYGLHEPEWQQVHHLEFIKSSNNLRKSLVSTSSYSWVRTLGLFTPLIWSKITVMRDLSWLIALKKMLIHFISCLTIHIVIMSWGISVNAGYFLLKLFLYLTCICIWHVCFVFHDHKSQRFCCPSCRNDD